MTGSSNAPDARSAGELLELQADRLGGRPYLRCDPGEWVSYAELDDRSARLAFGLRELGVGRGDRVALLSANCPEMAESIFACSKLGAVQVPVNTFLRGEFLRHQLVDSGAQVAIVDADGYRSLRRLGAPAPVQRFVIIGPDDFSRPECVTIAALHEHTHRLRSVRPRPGELAAIMYTSGTTGPSKGCMLPHGAFTIPTTCYAQAGYVLPGDRVLTPSPLFHMGCQSAMLMAPLANDASVCLVERFSASGFMPLAREIGATVLYGVGAAAIAILRQPPHEADATNELRCAVWIPLSRDKADEFERRFGVRTMTQAYGQTEFPTISLGNIDEPRGDGSAGTPVEIAQVSVLDDEDRAVATGEVGEIAVRPLRANVMSLGYWNQSAASVRSSSNLWHHTGDLGRMDKAGRVWVVDRKVDALRRRGENVSSTELEAAIRRHPAVDEVAVLGVASAMSEQEIKACIRLAPGQRLEPRELFAFFQAELPYFAIPRYVELVETFPVNAAGRIRKDVLREDPLTPATWDLEAMGLRVAPAQRR